jgi:hypothetical protein
MLADSFHPVEGSNMFLRNVGSYKSCMASHPRRRHCTTKSLAHTRLQRLPPRSYQLVSHYRTHLHFWSRHQSHNCKTEDIPCRLPASAYSASLLTVSNSEGTTLPVAQCEEADTFIFCVESRSAMEYTSNPIQRVHGALSC